MIHRTLPLLALLALACGGGSPDADGGGAGSIDAGRPLRDAGCGPVAPTGPDPECVMETCFGGLQCVNGPCPIPCCMDGRLETCQLANGYECNVPAPMDCGGGTCVGFGEPCP